MLILHLIAAVLALAFPVLDYRESARLRTAAGRQARAQCYVRSIRGLWLAALAVIALVPLDRLWNPPQPMRSLSGAVSPDFLLAFVPTVIAGLLLQLIVAFFHPGMRRFLLGQFHELDYLLPRTRIEIALFAGLSVSAGVCEEVLYRGFLFHYLQTMSWHLSSASTILLGSALFGIAHLGQGVKGMLMTGVAGLVLGGLYVLTGSLLLPMVVHTLIDLRATAIAYLRTMPQQSTA